MPSKKQNISRVKTTPTNVPAILRELGDRILKDIHLDPACVRTPHCLDMATLRRCLTLDRTGNDPSVLHINTCNYCSARLSSLQHITQLEIKRNELLAQLSNSHTSHIQADIFKALYEDHNYSLKEIAKQAHKPITYVEQWISYACMPIEVRQAIDSGELSLEHAKVLAGEPLKFRVFYAQIAQRKQLSPAALKHLIESPMGRNDYVEVHEETDKSLSKAKPLDTVIPCPHGSHSPVIQNAEGSTFMLTMATCRQPIRIIIDDEVPHDHVVAWLNGLIKMLSQMKTALIESKQKGTSFTAEAQKFVDADDLPKKSN